MFTGLVSDIGKIIATNHIANGIAKYNIETNYEFDSILIGASISCSGACMTVVSKHTDSFKTNFWVDVSQESLSITNLKNWQVGTQINLEKSLKMGDELGGHMVSGHVDSTAKIIAIQPEAGSIRFTFEIVEKLKKFIAPKGSVALNGTSLTINEVAGCHFGVNIIPHTLEVTTWSQLKVGDIVNLEVDQMARHVAQIVEHQLNLLEKG